MMTNYLAASLEFFINALLVIIKIHWYYFLLAIGILFGVYILWQFIDAILDYYGSPKLKQALKRIKTRPTRLCDMIGGLLVIAWWRFIISIFFAITTFPDKSVVTSRGRVPTPFIGNLSIDQYVDTVNYLLGLLALIMLVAHIIAGTLISFSFGYRFFKGLWIAILFASYSLLLVAAFFNLIMIALG